MATSTMRLAWIFCLRWGPVASVSLGFRLPACGLDLEIRGSAVGGRIFGGERRGTQGPSQDVSIGSAQFGPGVRTNKWITKGKPKG